MKLFKFVPLVGLVLSVSAAPAFALGKDSVEDTGGKMCAKLAAELIKKDRVPARASTPAGTKTDDGRVAEPSATAM